VTKIQNIPGAPTAGWIVLIGGGEFSFGETREIDEFIIAKMPPDNRRVAFLPTASQSPEYATHLGAYLKTIDPALETENVPVYRPRDARRGKNLDRISSAGLIYIGGGVTNHIVATMRGTPAIEAIGNALARGAVLAAIGAGAAALGVATRDMERTGAHVPGLGIIPDSVIDTGFNPSDDTMLRRLMSVPEARVGFGIPVTTALAIAPDRSGEIIGAGKIAVVRKA
jgi:cyanophycinase-like exopeptidase